MLEIGSGCGAITGILAKKAGEVTCIELSKMRSTINAFRNRDWENVRILVGNFQDIEESLQRLMIISPSSVCLNTPRDI